MDIISHGLRWWIAVWRKNKKQFFWAFLFGILPDLLSFGFFTVIVFLGFVSAPDRWTHHDMSQIPQYVTVTYNVMHSLVTRTVAFGVVQLIRPAKAGMVMLAWLFHIVLDIFTHSRAFFPTQFLRPFSSITFNGISRWTWYIRRPDIALLIIIYSIYFWKKYFRHRKK
jgi:hypothetical protein